jgi:ABC-2 type transport system permease protein
VADGIYRHLIRAQVRSQTEYRLSFGLDLVFTTLMTGVEVVTLIVLFGVAPVIGGLRLPEALVVAGIAAVAFGLADLAVGNIERLPQYIRTGLLDTVLIRPLGALPQLVAGDFAPRRIGRVVQGAVVLALALRLAEIDWTPARIALAAVAPLAGAVMFASIFVAGATLAFWLVEGGEVANAFTYGGRDFSTYPTSVFGGWFRRIFAYGLGLAFAAYLPAMALLGRDAALGLPSWLGWCSPVAALGWAAAASWFWKFGVRHYRSTGS